MHFSHFCNERQRELAGVEEWAEWCEEAWMRADTSHFSSQIAGAFVYLAATSIHIRLTTCTYKHADILRNSTS